MSDLGTPALLAIFVGAALATWVAGVNLAIVDLFPPTPRDPEGLHALLWGRDDDDQFHFDANKPLICASYLAGLGVEAFVEPFAVEDPLPTIPLFLTSEDYLELPLEATYQAAFEAVPAVWQEALTRSARRSR